MIQKKFLNAGMFFSKSFILGMGILQTLSSIQIDEKMLMRDGQNDSSSLNLLITGVPGVGKTTFIQRLAERLKAIPVAGFFTAEIRERGSRKGFRIAAFDGPERTLAHVDIHSTCRVSRYGVDVRAVDDIVAHLKNHIPERGLWLIDEIGKMESFSSQFREFIESILESSLPVVATISLKTGGWIGSIRNRPEVRIIKLTEQNRDAKLEETVRWLQKMGTGSE